MYQQSDSELIQAYLSGNEAAVEILINRHKRKLYTYIYYHIRDSNVVADIFQDTFIKAFDSIRKNKYIDDGRFEAWIARIAHNLIVDHIRKEGRLKTVAIDNYEYDILNNKKTQRC